MVVGIGSKSKRGPSVSNTLIALCSLIADPRVLKLLGGSDCSVAHVLGICFACSDCFNFAKSSDRLYILALCLGYPPGLFGSVIGVT